MSDKKEYYVVDADALRRILNALNGPSHYIRELQVTRNLPGSEPNPIDVIEKQVKMQENLPSDVDLREMEFGGNNVETLKFAINARTASHSPNAAGLALKALEPVYCKAGGWKIPTAEKSNVR